MFTNTTTHFVCFGEVLFDVFKGTKKIAGAPLNVALRIHAFNFPVLMISAIGADTDGDTILGYLQEHALDTKTIQKVENLKTGTVQVALDASGAASYTINYPVAWDKITPMATTIEAAKRADVFIYGSLACRDEVSRKTLFYFLEVTQAFKVFDVNLRAPFYSYSLVEELMLAANLIKFNDEELLEIVENLGAETTHNIEEAVMFIAKKTNTNAICVTRGKNGAVLYFKGKWYYNSGYVAKVKDTVGAGDSFLATLLCKLIGDKEPQMALDMACAVGSLVASAEGANPKLSTNTIKALLNGY